MAKYQCLDCGHTWESKEEPFVCPNCNGSNFNKVGGGGGTKKWLKPAGIILGAILALVVLIKIIGGTDDTKVTTIPDKDKGKLEILIEGKHSNEYQVTLSKDGVAHYDVSKKAKHTIRDLQGTYSLKINFKGSGKAPKINNFPPVFTFPIPEVPAVAPEIIKLSPNPVALSPKVATCTVTILTDTTLVPLKDTEFSKDGQTWQVSNKFKGIPAGTHTFYARHKNDKDLQNQASITIRKPVPPTKEEITQLLAKIAQGDGNAVATLLNKISPNTPVKGVVNIADVNQLIVDASMGIFYTVTSVNLDTNDVVISITATRK